MDEHIALEDCYARRLSSTLQAQISLMRGLPANAMSWSWRERVAVDPNGEVLRSNRLAMMYSACQILDIVDSLGGMAAFGDVWPAALEEARSMRALKALRDGALGAALQVRLPALRQPAAARLD